MIKFLNHTLNKYQEAFGHIQLSENDHKVYLTYCLSTNCNSETSVSRKGKLVAKSYYRYRRCPRCESSLINVEMRKEEI